jgi:hypothetical protein
VSGASVWPSLRLHVACASEEGAIPISHLGYQHLEKEESRALTPNSRAAKGIFGIIKAGDAQGDNEG